MGGAGNGRAPGGGAQDPAGRELRALREQLRVCAAHVRGIVFEFDAAARYVSVWTSDPALLAAPTEALVGRTIVEVLGEEAGRPLVERVERAFETGRSESFEYVLDVQGGRRWFSAEASLPQRESGRPPTVTMLVRDVTERRQMEAQLRRAERLATVGMLAAGVAHEVNNPLGYIMLNLQRSRSKLRALASGGGDAAEIAAMEDALGMAWEGAERVRRIVQDLTTFARDDDDARAPLDVRRALDLAADVARAELRDRAELVCEYGLVPRVLANEGRLLQVFINLLQNAAHAVLPGDPRANEVRIVTSTDARGWAVIEVRDTGAGIPPAVLGKIFDPFFTTKGAGVGTGLGLSICHGIVEALGGEIGVDSQVGCGSTFRVSLPPAEP